MPTLDPRWRKFWQNLGWFILLVAISMILVRVERIPIWLPWLVALAGGLWLVWQQYRGHLTEADDAERIGCVATDA